MAEVTGSIPVFDSMVISSLHQGPDSDGWHRRLETRNEANGSESPVVLVSLIRTLCWVRHPDFQPR